MAKNEAQDMGVTSGKDTRAGVAPLHGAVFLFGMAGLFGKWIALAPMLIVFGRVAVAACALGILLQVLGRGFRRVGRESAWLILLGGAVLAFHWAAFFQAIQVSTVAVGLLGYATAPVFAGFLEPLAFREPFSRRTLLGSLVTIAGIALIVPPWGGENAVFQGMAWGVGAGFSFAVLSLLNRKLRSKHDSVTIAFYEDGAAAVILLPFLPFFWSRPAAADLLLVVILGVIFTALAHALFIHSLRVIRARTATLVSTLEPVYGIAFAALLLGEIPSARIFGGGALILLAVAWVTLQHEPDGGRSDPPGSRAGPPAEKGLPPDKNRPGQKQPAGKSRGEATLGRLKKVSTVTGRPLQKGVSGTAAG